MLGALRQTWARMRRGGVTVVDQGVSSLSNFLLILAVGRWASPGELGVLTLLTLYWLLLLGLSRALVSQPMTILVEDHRITQWLRAQFVLALAASSGALVIAVAVALAGGPVAAVLTLGLAMPALLVQDFWRWVGFASGKPSKALVNDGIFLAVEVGALAVLGFTGAVTAASGLVAWGIGALAGAIYGSRQFGIRRERETSLLSLAALKETRHLGQWLAVDFLSNFGLGQIYLVLVSVLAGAEMLGGWRAVQNLLGPVNLITIGLGIASTAESARAYRSIGPAGLQRTSRAYGWSIAGGVLAYGVLYVGLGDVLVPAVYGAAYEQFTVLVPFAVAELLIRVLRHVPRVRLQVTQRPRRVAVAKLLATPASLVVAALALANAGDVGPGLAAVSVSVLWSAATWVAYLTSAVTLQTVEPGPSTSSSRDNAD